MEGFYEVGRGNSVYPAGFTLDTNAYEMHTAYTRIITMRYFHDRARTVYAGKLDLTLDKKDKMLEIAKTYRGEDGVVSYHGEIQRETNTVRVFQEFEMDTAEGQGDVRSVVNLFSSVENGQMMIALVDDGEGSGFVVADATHYDTKSPLNLIPTLSPRGGFTMIVGVNPGQLAMDSICLPDGNMTIGATTPNGAMYMFEMRPNGALVKPANYLKGFIGLG